MEALKLQIKLYGLPTCFRCKTAEAMLEKRREVLEKAGTTIEFVTVPLVMVDCELPQLSIDGKVFYGKDALLKIRELNTFADPVDNNIKQ